MSKETITDYKCTGIITKEELKKANLLPPESIFKTKRVAFLECVESIPCDACKFSCSFDAIIKPTISTPPVIDWEKCTGCMKCVIKCPGLTIFMVDGRKSDEEVQVIIPYELIPFPVKGQEVKLLNREGGIIGKGKVTLAIDPKRNQQTGLLGFTVSNNIWEDVRSVRLE
ncbi:MAG: 4Fe-4S binding protein [Candidatus Ranarchaeia archaeon]